MFERMRLSISHRNGTDRQYAKLVRQIGEAALPMCKTGDGTTVVPLAYNYDASPEDEEAFNVECTGDSKRLISFVYPDVDPANADVLAKWGNIVHHK